MLDVNLINGLSDVELIEAKTQIENAIVERKSAKIKALTDEMKKWGISTSDLNGYGKVEKEHVKLPMKYVNPDDATQQWSGKGKPPKWVKECLDRGLTKTDLEIT